MIVTHAAIEMGSWSAIEDTTSFPPHGVTANPSWQAGMPRAGVAAWSDIDAPTLRDRDVASDPVAERLRALEQLLAASLATIDRLRADLMHTRADAASDALTGLANRRGFDVALRAATEHASDMASPLCLLILDIDHFKRFNDTHGHQLGDAVLRLVGRVILGQVRTCDVAARHGGEEFAVVLPGATLAIGMVIAEQIRQVLEHRPVIDRATGTPLDTVTCSIGVALFRDGETTDALVDRCDRALYRAKREGRNRVAVEAGVAAAVLAHADA